VLLEQVALTWAQVAETAARSKKVDLLAQLLSVADEPDLVVAWLSGDLVQRQIGVGWAALRDPPASA